MTGPSTPDHPFRSAVATGTSATITVGGAICYDVLPTPIMVILLCVGQMPWLGQLALAIICRVFPQESHDRVIWWRDHRADRARRRWER